MYIYTYTYVCIYIYVCTYYNTLLIADCTNPLHTDIIWLCPNLIPREILGDFWGKMTKNQWIPSRDDE